MKNNQYLVLREHGKSYDVLMFDGVYNKYPMGQLLVEFVLLDMKELTILIDSYKGYNDSLNKSNIEKALAYYKSLFVNKLLISQAKLLYTEFSQKFGSYIAGDVEIVNKIAELPMQDNNIYADKVRHNIEEANTVGEYLEAILSYLEVVQNIAKAFTEKRALQQDITDCLTALFSLNKSYYYTQGYTLDYHCDITKIPLTQIKYVKDVETLIFLEIINIMTHNTELLKCAHCGRLFIPTRNSATRYCGYPSIENSSKLCRDVVTRKNIRNKIKNDTVKATYARKYNKLKIYSNRHPEDIRAKNRVDNLRVEYQIMKRKLDNNLINEDDFLEWLNNYDANSDSAIMDIF